MLPWPNPDTNPMAENNQGWVPKPPGMKPVRMDGPQLSNSQPLLVWTQCALPRRIALIPLGPSSVKKETGKKKKKKKKKKKDSNVVSG